MNGQYSIISFADMADMLMWYGLRYARCQLCIVGTTQLTYWCLMCFGYHEYKPVINYIIGTG